MVSDMKCANCGSELKVGARFCANCGTNVTMQTPQFTQFESQTPVAVATTEELSSGPVLYKRNNQKTVAIACMIVIGIVVIALISLFIWKSSAPKELSLEADTIKDEALRNTLVVQYDKDGDGKLSEEELGEVQSLELDAGDEYDYIYMFWNLRSLTVKNSEIKSLDLSENSNLERADLREGESLVKVKLPSMKDYDNVVIPKNPDVDIDIPSNSEYEVKYVPKKVTESTINTSQYGNSSKTVTYTQDVQSATRVNSLIIQEQGMADQTFTYSYDNLGRVSSWGGTKDIIYDDNNQVKSESSQVNSPIYTTLNATYEDDRDVLNLSVPSLTSGTSTELKQENGALSIVDSRTSNKTGYWKFDGEKLSEATLHLGTNGACYTKWNYSWNGNRAESLKLTLLDNDYGSVSNLTSIEAYNSMNVGATENISFEYDGNNLVKATYSSGFEQFFTYDSHGNVVSVTSTGTPAGLIMDFTTNCTIEYETVFVKKNSEALNFLTVPGQNDSGIFNNCSKVRGITLVGTVSLYTAFTQDFTGKFWWDEENVVNSQVEKAQLSKNAKSIENSTEDNKPQVDPVQEKKTQLINEGYDVYEGTMQVYTSYDDKSIYAITLDEEVTVSSYMMVNGKAYGETTTKIFTIGTDFYYSQLGGKVPVGTRVLFAGDPPYCQQRMFTGEVVGKNEENLGLMAKGKVVNLDTMEEVTVGSDFN